MKSSTMRWVGRVACVVLMRSVLHIMPNNNLKEYTSLKMQLWMGGLYSSDIVQMCTRAHCIYWRTVMDH